MRNRIIIILVSILHISFSITLYFPFVQGGMAYVYNTPDRNPPFNLTEHQFGSISTITCLIFILISIILSFYNIFKSNNYKQLILPSILTISVLTLLLLVKPDYILKSEARFPKDEFYFWQQTRQYRNEVKFIRWKKPLNSKSKTWQLDSISVRNEY